MECDAISDFYRRSHKRLSVVYPSTWEDASGMKLMQGQTYMNLALMQARNGRSPDSALGKVMEVDSGNERYAYIDFSRSDLPRQSGLVYCYQGDQTKAMEMLEQRIDPITLAPRMPQTELGRLETIKTMTLSSLRAEDRNLERTVHFWIACIEGAKALKSEVRFLEAVALLDHMETVWPGESRIAELHDLVVHWEV
jgi:hypothetical protein